MRLVDRLISQFKFEFIGRIVATGSDSLLIVLLARLLKQEDYGLLFLAISVFGVLRVLSRLGIARSGARYVAEYQERDATQIPNILRMALGYNLVTILVVSVGLLVTRQHLAVRLGEPDLAPLLLVGVLFIIFGTLSFFVRVMLQGFEAIKLSAAVYVIERTGRLLFAVGLVFLGFEAIGALTGYILSFVIASSFGLWILYSRFYCTFNRGDIEDGLRRRIGEYTLPLTATSTANTLEKQVDTILVGFFLDPIAVSFYVISKQVVTVLNMPMVSVGFSLSPTLGAEKVAGNINQISKVYQSLLEYLLVFYIPAATGLVLVARPTIELVFGPQYLGATPVLQVLSIYTIFLSIMRITSTGLDYLGRAKYRAIAQGITASLNVLLNILLIPTIGVVGAAIATVITYGLYTILNLYIINLEFNLQISSILSRLGHTTVVTAVMGLVVYLIRGLISGWITLLFVILLGFGTWSIIAVGTRLIKIKDIYSTLGTSNR